MRYELYIDVFFLVNFMMDAILLEIVRKILKCPATHGRIFLGAAAGALGTCFVIVLPIPYAFVKFLLFHGLVNLLMLKTGLGTGWDRTLLKGWVLLYISGFLMGGVLGFLRQYIRTASLFFAFAIASYYVVLGIWNLLRALAGQEARRCGVILYQGERQYQTQALIDTGNSLRDPFTGKPVSILGPAAAEKLGNWREAKGLHFIPYHSVGRKEGVLPAFPLDRMCILKKGPRMVEKPMVAVCEEEITAGDYEVILNPDV